MPAPQSNGKRRHLALDEIENIARLALTDLATLTTSVEVILAEMREARKVS